MNAFWAVARNEMTQLYRDVWFLLLMTVGSVGILTIMAYTLSADMENITVVVVDLDRTTYSRQFIQTLTSDALFSLEFATSPTEAKRQLRDGQSKAVLIIPPDYSWRIQRGQAVRVQALIDGSEPGVAGLLRDHLAAHANSVSQALAAETLAQRGLAYPPPLEFRPRIRYNPNLKTIISVLPGLMALVLSVSAVGASAAFARERERGNFELLISTPLGRWPLLLGRVFPYLLVGLFDIGLFVLLGLFVFKMPLRGSLTLFLAMGMLYVFATTGAGVLIAQFVSSQHAAMIITFMLFGIAPTYLADIFFPLYTMPRWLQLEGAVMPATHFTVIARGIFLKGIGLETLWPNALALFATGGATSVLAFMRFQKRLRD